MAFLEAAAAVGTEADVDPYSTGRGVAMQHRRLGEENSDHD